MEQDIRPRPTYLSAEQLAHFRQKLLDLRKDVAEELEHEHEEVEVEREQHYDETPTVSTDTVERLSAHELDLIGAIDAALERIEGGTYGVCVKTGENIPVERLEAVPYADRTLSAERAHELSGETGAT